MGVVSSQGEKVITWPLYIRICCELRRICAVQVILSLCLSVSLSLSDSSSHSRLHLPTYVSGFWGLVKDSSDPRIEHPHVTYGTDNGICSISVLYCVVVAGGNLCLAAKAPTIHCDILLRATEYIKNCDSRPAGGCRRGLCHVLDKWGELQAKFIADNVIARVVLWGKKKRPEGKLPD